MNEMQSSEKIKLISSQGKHISAYERLKNPLPTPRALTYDLSDRLRHLNISDKSIWFVNFVADRIADTGKHVDDLTVRQLREIIEECRIASNAAAKRKLLWWKYI